MSYTYSQALVAAFSVGNCLDTAQFVPSKSSLTQEPFLWHDKTMALSPRSQFGMTCEPLEENRGAALLTWWLAGFPVKTSALLAKEWELSESAADCGVSLPASWAKYDPATHSLKTAQCSLLEDLTGCSLTLPRWGSMRSGAVYPLVTVELGMREIESGFSPNGETTFHTPSTGGLDGGSNSRKALAKKKIQTWPTPCSTDSKGAGKSGELRDRLDYAVERGATKSQTYESPQQAGQLNPMWEDWLMGWPIGHTGLEPLATGRFQEWRQSHSVCLKRG